jgi:hypothetical protein
LNDENRMTKAAPGSLHFYIGHSTFDILRFASQLLRKIAEQQHTKCLIPLRKMPTALWKNRLLDDPQVPLSPAAQFVFGVALKLHEGISVELIVLFVVRAPVINLAPVHIPGRN